MHPTVFARGNQRTHKQLAALRQAAHTAKQPRVALRIQGIMMSLDKYSVAQIAQILKMERSTVYLWILAWNAHGIEGLYEGYRSGRPTKLDSAQKQQLADILDSGPVAYGLDTGVWTSPLVKQVIEGEFQTAYHVGHVRKLLRELGFSVQRPTTRLAQADPQQQQRWIRYTYPNLKKKPGPKER